MEEGKLYQIEWGDVRTGLRGAKLRVEARLDGSITISFKDRYLRIRVCEQPLPVRSAKRPPAPGVFCPAVFAFDCPRPLLLRDFTNRRER